MLSSRAWLIDLLHSIGEKLALCDHLAEKLDDENARELYFKVLEERRKEMRILANYGENTNLEYWCALKHSLKAWVLAVEVYDSMPNDENLNVVKYNEDILAGVLSLFLGLEFKPCARCLNDILIGTYNKNSINNNERSYNDDSKTSSAV